RINLWEINPNNHKESKFLSTLGYFGSPTRIAVLPDGRLVSVCYKHIRIWDTKKLTPDRAKLNIDFKERHLEGAIGNVIVIDDKKLALSTNTMGYYPASIFIWEITEQGPNPIERIERIQAHTPVDKENGYAMTALPGGNFISSLGSSDIKEWTTE